MSADDFKEKVKVKQTSKPSESLNTDKTHSLLPSTNIKTIVLIAAAVIIAAIVYWRFKQKQKPSSDNPDEDIDLNDLDDFEIMNDEDEENNEDIETPNNPENPLDKDSAIIEEIFN